MSTPTDQSLIASSFDDPAKCLWGCLKKGHTIKSFKEGDKFGFKQVYTFEDHLNQSLKPTHFKLVVYNEDIHRIKLKKHSYYMISDCVQEGHQLYKATNSTFFIELIK